MLKELIKKYGIRFKGNFTNLEKKIKMIKYLQDRADCEQSVQGSMEYLNEIRDLKKGLIEDFVIEMDKQGKVGWTETGFQELTYDEKVIISSYNLLAQVSNGGVEQYYYNGYGFANPFLIQEVAVQLDIPELADWLNETIKVYAESESNQKLNQLDKKFYLEIMDKLVNRLKNYIIKEL
ncbi:MAG: DMP19 family protein [Halanaerobiales bacterium]|nr:DMP19 family protein [Halanaerobiales bacterium]